MLVESYSKICEDCEFLCFIVLFTYSALRCLILQTMRFFILKPSTLHIFIPFTLKYSPPVSTVLKYIN